MKIWKFRFKSNSFRSMEFIVRPSMAWSESLDGRSQIDVWKSYEARWVPEAGSAPMPDIAGFSYNLPAFNQKALTALSPIIKDEVEFLPLSCEGEDWWVVNVTDVVDCLDWEQAQAEYYPSSGRLMYITEYQFAPEKVMGHNIFRLADQPRKFPFVSETFKSRVEECGLTGCEFLLVWDSECEEEVRLSILS